MARPQQGLLGDEDTNGAGENATVTPPEWALFPKPCPPGQLELQETAEQLPQPVWRHGVHHHTLGACPVSWPRDAPKILPVSIPPRCGNTGTVCGGKWPPLKVTSTECGAPETGAAAGMRHSKTHTVRREFSTVCFSITGGGGWMDNGWMDNGWVGGKWI